jgi:hypothetical protein
MSGGFRGHWEYMAADVWEPLAAHEKAPPDLFGDLFYAGDDYLALPTSEAVLEEILNDADKARQAFLPLKGSDFAGETAIVRFLEEAHKIIDDYDIAGYAEYFKLLVKGFIRKYNLRYRLDDPFALRFLLPGSFSNLYLELNRVNTTNPHLSGLLQDFEHAFDSYARSQNPADLKTCIAKASNYAEGLASHTLGNPATNNTLGKLASTLTCWPHDKIKESLINLYHFCCDYPGIRHGGKPASKRRDLVALDSTLICLLILGFAGYLSPNVDERFVLGV